MSERSADTIEWYADRYGWHAANWRAAGALNLDPSTTIVDVGCGTGSALRHAAARVTDGKLLGINPVPRMVEIARKRVTSHPRGARIEFREGSAESIPVEDSTADLVFALDSFDHWQDKAIVLAEVRRILQPDGRLVVVKDHAVPGGPIARNAFRHELVLAGFTECEKRKVATEGVSFTVWICRLVA